MSNVLVNVTAFGQTALQDLLGIEAAAKPGTWISQSLSFGVVASFEIPGSVWTRLRPQLNALANTRVPAMDSAGVGLGTGKTQPALIYSMEWVPGDRPRIHRTGTNTVVPAIAATGQITAVSGAALVNGTTFTLDDGDSAPTVFEFNSGGGVGAGHVPVAFTALDTVATVALAIQAAINGVGGSLSITAATPVGAVIALTNDVAGAAGNTSSANTSACTVSDMAGGVDTVTTAQLSVSHPSDVTVYGTNLLGGYAASSTLQTWSGSYSYAMPGTRSFTRAVDALKIVANAKGPIGNKIAYSIEKESGGGSVAVTMGADGEVYIKVTPAASSSNSTAIAAQINGAPAAAEFVTATALVASSRISPTTSPQLPGVTPGGLTASSSGQITKVYLTGGDGGGVAILDVCSTAGVVTNRLRLTAVTGGNDRNQITMTLTLGTSNAISVVDRYNIVVSRAASTVSIATLVSVINGHAPARALVVASAVGTDSNLIAAFSKTWLYGGGGETPVATLAGAATSITSQSDTQMVLHTTAGALAAVSATAGQMADVQIQMNYGLVASNLGVLAA